MHAAGAGAADAVDFLLNHAKARGLSRLVDDPIAGGRAVLLVFGGAAAVFGSREGFKLLRGRLEAILGRPALVRETSRKGLALRERFGGTEHDPLGTARGVAGPQLTALEAIERLEPSLDIEEEQPHVLHWQTKKPSVAREEFGGHGVGSTTKGKGGKCFKCQQVGHWAAECPN